ncbi:hypothetical protein [Plantactinospora sp. KLBMP9567]|uniref:hypothetical protein n=1 Tax=Plantactinospora sp. KLBMP9567 TaxID=3085900 RepID=UPI0029812E6D|nr:hypothetical protein [Plantactinospora sp. KLBMP9567]MDW5328323.1 hypothetical protein [Plantactinospora sp. KLBMP9567]
MEVEVVPSSRALATGIALAAVTLTTQGCAPSGDTISSGTSSPVATETSAAGPSGRSPSGDTDHYDEILAGDRKVLIHIAGDDKDWSATYEGPIAIGDGTDDGALFRIVPTPDGRHLLETLRAREEGGRCCVYGDTRTEPVRLSTKTCAEDETTLFKVTKADGTDDQGRFTHHLTNEKFGAVQVKNDGSALYIQEVGDGGTRGTYSFVDRGPIE